MTRAPLLSTDFEPEVKLELELPYAVDGLSRAASPEQAATNEEDWARWNIGGSSAPSYPSSLLTYHPGTRVEVDARLAKHRPGNVVQLAPKHGLTVERVQAQARSRGYWPFRNCFEVPRRNKSAGGETRVAFTIGLRGQVSHARLLDSVLDEPSTISCLLHEAAKLSFTPRPVRALQMVLTIRIWPGDAESPTLPNANEVRVIGADFEPEAVRARLTEKLRELTTCFAEARRTDAALWGRLALATTLEVDGSVHRVSEVESRFPNALVIHCVQVVVGSVVFPSINGKPFTFVLPMRLLPMPNSIEPGSDPGPKKSPDEAGP